MKRALLSLITITLCAAAAVAADDNIRKAQARLKSEGFYFGEVSGTFDNDTSAAITRYQIRKGLQITGQLDHQTATALDVTASAASAKSGTTDSGSWQRLRKSDRRFLERLESTKLGRKAGQVAAAPSPALNRRASEGASAQSAPAVGPAETIDSGAATTGPTANVSADGPLLVLSRERLRDYVGAFILAGLDPRVGAELEFFADQVNYYNKGRISRDKIRADLQRYNAQWPERRFWLSGEIDVQPQADGIRVTFPLRYQLRNGTRLSAGEIRKSLLLEVVGEDLQIAAVNERKLR